MTAKKRLIFLAVLLTALVALPAVGDESTARTKDIRAFATSLEYFTAWFDRLIDAAFSRARVENAPDKIGGLIDPGGEPTAGDGQDDEIGGLIDSHGGSHPGGDPPSDEIGGLIEPNG